MFLLISIINAVYYILLILIFARFILSWVRPDPYHPTWGPITRFVFQATEPLLAPIRRLLPATGGLDFSPMILLFGLYFLRSILFGILF
ncbi:MAG: YggT family protein [Candidatus Promineifilaceae bacterium]|nr:YggT family protein [Candidatus Promineifilaceae bacterium]